MHKILIYLHIIDILKSSACLKHYSAHLQEVYVIIVYMLPLVSSLSAGDCLVHRLRKFFLNRCTGESPAECADAAHIQLRRRPPADGQSNVRNFYRILIYVLYVNKQEFCASSWRSTKVKENSFRFQSDTTIHVLVLFLQWHVSVNLPPSGHLCKIWDKVCLVKIAFT
jgi:hypothetical protein